ncbi:S1 family peptidase [Methylobacterium soli]|uniref:S1 family peptidase n=1 Tax=Methylobacterium soli TaxID=553447 RepID=A0A6L3SNW8_9HYPH|nr:S1 family peptidase [Methylobacterium soli]KAB1070131.1 S1 family peptidase [Methylobacterium soli]GJE44318.1 hypothetical protein AEGHOMDF_3506 [Methylobacterium soli]
MKLTLKQLSLFIPCVMLALLGWTLRNQGSRKEAAAFDRTFPGVVAAEFSRDRILCSGVIVSRTAILTAAHCLCEERPISAFIGRTVFAEGNAGFQTRLDLQLREILFFDEPFCEQYRINAVEAMRRGDVALVWFKHALPDDIAAAVLPQSGLSRLDAVYSRFVAVGWGESDNLWRPGRKNFTEIKLVSRLCGESDQQLLGCSSMEIVAADKPYDTCYADSGGALYAVSDKGDLELMAVTSRALRATEGGMCGDGGVYTSLENRDIRSWFVRTLAKGK